MLKVENVTAGYGRVPVLRDVCFEVREGECACLLGLNGAGKSTMMRIISGLLRPFSGTVSLDGTVVTKLAPHDIVDLGIIQVPEGRQLFPQMTVEENLLLGARNIRAKTVSKRSFEKVYALFPAIARRKTQLAGTLSGGEQQMVAIGRGLMAKPRILLLDEPSVGLAPLLAREIFAAFSQLTHDGIGILLVEQNVKLSLSASSHGFVLQRGQIVLHGASKDLVEDDGVRKGFLGA